VAIQKPNRWQYSIHKESTDLPLEDLANLPFERLCELVLHRRREERIKAEEEKRRSIIQREMETLAAQREQEKRAKAEAERLAALERAKEAALLDDARSWQSAALIRAYLKAIGPASTKEQQLWQTWATQVADRMDPTKARS
jgi:hypothetical protein